MVTELAKEFSTLLYTEIGDSLFIVADQSHLSLSDPCVSHEHCDANMVMLEAYRNVKKDPEADIKVDDESTDMCNAAWLEARKNNFYVLDTEAYQKWKQND